MYVQAIRDATIVLDIPGLKLDFKTSRSAVRLFRRMEAVGLVVPAIMAQEGDVFFSERDGGGHSGFVRGPFNGKRVLTLEGDVADASATVAPMSRLPASLLAIVRYR